MIDELQYRYDIENAPRDGTPILAYCDHGADPRYLEDGKSLTTYAAHSEELGNVADGPNVVVFGGEYEEYDDFTGRLNRIPPYWFLYGSEFEIVAHPILWHPLPQLVRACLEEDKSIDSSL